MTVYAIQDLPAGTFLQDKYGDPRFGPRRGMAVFHKKEHVLLWLKRNETQPGWTIVSFEMTCVGRYDANLIAKNPSKLR